MLSLDAERSQTSLLASTKTLILNADFRPLSYAPLSTMSWEDAVHAVYGGRFQVVAEYEDLVARSPSLEIKIPSVIAHKEYVPVKRHPAFSRTNVYLRDRYRCQYCGKRFPTRELTFDHVVPRARGGKSTWTNIVTACVPCNTLKGSKSLAECGLRLLRKPERPAWSDFYEAGRSVMPSEGIHQAWNDFLYWTVELDQS